ncbi:methyltransferase domain-containing protein [Flavobacterium sp. LB2P84]|uniref:methyltransferase domain-containing protein n=1 Tax=Flavobacterium yafengii TaxID=3041253 RepID=UPI0024A84369|nr:methyltransferase domain-containing protein [Flavobacterium yafengii]MDI6034165.1 methyltransferase domain-containing protein [Flavobacterium yafengii]
MKNYKNLNRGQWAELKLSEVVGKLPNNIVSDIGSGFGWFKPIIEKFNLIWQPFDCVKKIEESSIWDLNNPAPENTKKPGFVVFLEVLEHLSNPELGIRNISNHIVSGGYMALTTPNPLSAESKFTLLFKNNLYAFQSKHLIEHHVYVPLPHIVQFHLVNNGFEVLEVATIGKLSLPKFRIRFNYLKELMHYFLLQLLVVIKPESKGSTQAFFVIKK